MLFFLHLHIARFYQLCHKGGAEMGKNRVIKENEVLLPDDYNFLEATGAWKYTCRVCDGDTFDQTHSSGLEDFMELD